MVFSKISCFFLLAFVTFVKGQNLQITMLMKMKMKVPVVGPINITFDQTVAPGFYKAEEKTEAERFLFRWIGGDITGEISSGLVVLLGVAKEDDEADARYLVEKIANLRIFADDDNRFNRSALDVAADVLVVSQFTLYADTRKGRRPDFNQAAGPEEAKRLYEYTVQLFRETRLTVATGTFQEHMLVSLENDGPVTLMLDSTDRRRSVEGPTGRKSQILNQPYLNQPMPLKKPRK